MNKNFELGQYLSGSSIQFNRVAELVRQGAHPDVKNINGDTILHLLIECNFYHLVPEVLKWPINVNSLNDDNKSALRCLLDKNPVPLNTAFLLVKKGGNVKTIDDDGNNLLHYAVKQGGLDEIFKALSLMIPQHHKNKEGVTPLAWLFKNRPDFFLAMELMLISGGVGGGSLKGVSLFLNNDELNFETGKCASYVAINRDGVRKLVRLDDSKEHVLDYLKFLPKDIQSMLVDRALDRTTLLGHFFAEKRGIDNTSTKKGTLKILKKMKKDFKNEVIESSVVAKQFQKVELPSTNIQEVAAPLPAPTLFEYSQGVPVYHPAPSAPQLRFFPPVPVHDPYPSVASQPPVYPWNQKLAF